MKPIKLLIVAMIATIALIATSCSKNEDSENLNTSSNTSSNPNTNSGTNPPVISTVTDINGNKYNTIAIGDQVWMKENLNVSKYRNGDIIPQVQDPMQWYNLTTGAWCYYANQTSNGLVYGKLYNWFAVNDPRGLAPQGWHIPNQNEWEVLDYFLSGSTSSGGKMKEAGTTHWISPNTEATNESNFTGLPGGFRYNTGTFENIGKMGYWWSSKSPSSLVGSLNYHLTNNSGYLIAHYHYIEYGFSVRCIKD